MITTLKENNITGTTRYEIVAENRGGLLVVKNNEQHNFFTCLAYAILANPKLIDGFSDRDVKKITSMAKENSNQIQ